MQNEFLDQSGRHGFCLHGLDGFDLVARLLRPSILQDLLAVLLGLLGRVYNSINMREFNAW